MNQQRAGVLYGVVAYGIWGLFPLYWPLLKPASAFEILAHRMVWSLTAVMLILLALRRGAWIREVLRQPKRLGMVAVAATVIAVNWGMYIWGVNSGQVVEASLGYFINPLVTIAFGVLVLHERLRRSQWLAVAICAAAVTVLTIAYGQLPWLALVLAFSFGTYGLVKKQIGLGGIESLAAETAVQFLPALGYLFFLGSRGQSTFTGQGIGHAVLLACAGLVTAVPLMLFGAAAVRVPLTTVGMLQYLAPIFQFLLGVLYFHEAMPPERWAGFALVWLALVLLTYDAMRDARTSRVVARGTDPVTAHPATAELAGDTAALDGSQ